MLHGVGKAIQIGTFATAAVLAVNWATGGIENRSLSTPEEVAAYKAELKQQQQQRKVYRCNDRIEDFVKALMDQDSSWRRDLAPAARLAWRCVRSPVGQEPREEYVLLTKYDNHWRSPEQRSGLTLNISDSDGQQA